MKFKSIFFKQNFIDMHICNWILYVWISRVNIYQIKLPILARTTNIIQRHSAYTVYPKKCAHGFVVLCFVVVMQSFIMNSHEVFIHIHQGCFAGTGAIVKLPQCKWSKPDGYGKISQCITTTKHRKAKTVCIFLGIYCMNWSVVETSAILHCLIKTGTNFVQMTTLLKVRVV